MNWINKRNFAIVLLVLFMSGMIPSLATAATTVSMDNVTVEQGKNVTVSIMLTGITNYGTGTINVEYDPSVAKVTDVAGNEISSIVAWYVNTSGKLNISAWNIQGTSGDVVLANVTFQGVGSSGSSTALTLTVNTLQDTSYTEISRDIKSGSLKISGTPSSTPTPTPGVTVKGNASVSLGAFIKSAIAIEVTPSDIDFGDLEPGGTSDGNNLTVKNKGSYRINVSSEVTDNAENLFVDGMLLNDKSWNSYSAVISKSGDDNPIAKLHVPDNYAGLGDKEGRLMFWATKT